MSALPRGECPVCGRVAALRVNGTLREHQAAVPWLADRFGKCVGSARPPRPKDTP